MTIYEVRNAYAHRAIPAPLTHDIANALLGKLPEGTRGWAADIEQQLPHCGTARNRFLACCLAVYAVLFELTDLIEDPEPRSVGPPIFGIGPVAGDDEES